MDADTALSKAHALAAQASALLAGHPSLDAQEEAARASDAAAAFFEQAREGAHDAGAATTLGLLAAQNRKQARLIERKAGAGRRAAAAGATAVTAAGTGSDGGASGEGLAAGLSAGAGAGVGSGASTGASTERRRRTPVSPTPRHRTSIPPFATTAAPQHLAQAGTPAFASASTSASVSASTLGGSSSSSDKFDDSFVVFGSAIDTSDPFARFWNVLETALHDITNPVAFASAPLQAGRRRREGGGAAGGDGREKSGGGKDDGKGKEKERGRGQSGETARVEGDRKGHERKGSLETVPSETDSFYLVSNEGDKHVLLDEDRESTPRHASASTAAPASKTPEELALENSSLRTSLDALSTHAHGLALEVRRLREREERKGEMMRSVVMGVRREAQKAIQSQELYRSQLLQASTVRGGSPSRRAGTSMTSRRDAERPSIGAVLDNASGPGARPTADETRIAQLEDQVKSLQLENEKQRAHLQKYRDRFEKLKTSARSKREARLHAATPLDVVGEENAGDG